MNISSGDTPLILLCPAWKRWGTASSVKQNTTILHSRADDVVPFGDSEELAKKSEAALIEVGDDLGDGFYRLNVLNTLKMVPEVCPIFCATANPTEVILAETEQGRGILGVVDGFSPKGVEDEGGDAVA